MIIPVYKPLGASSHQLAAQIGSFHAQKATHTGTLDPMAEGVLVVLTGEDRFKKKELATTNKEYHFTIIFGFQTDSHDLLGLQTKPAAKTKLSTQQIHQKLSTSISKYVGVAKQTQPLFSAGRLQGASLFDYGKAKITVTTPINTIHIKKLELLASEDLSIEKLWLECQERIGTVSGNFRQDECLASWKKALTARQRAGCTSVPRCALKATVTKRTYIRGLVRDLSEELDIPATTFSIVRTKNGPFTLSDCITVPPKQ